MVILLLVTVVAFSVVLISVLLALLSPDTLQITEQALARTRSTFFDLVIQLGNNAGVMYFVKKNE